MSYIGTQPTQLTLETRQEFVATALQTTFNTNPYTVGYVDCYLNGVKLSTSDFTANTGNQVVLGTGATAGDILAVVMKKPDYYPLPITDSAGNNVLSESGGVVTLNNGTIGSSVVFPTGNCIAIHTTTSNASQSTTSGDNTFAFGTVTTQKNNSKIVCAVSTRIYRVAGSPTSSIDNCIFLGTGLTGETLHYMYLEGNINSYSTGFFTGTMNSTTTLTIQARVLHAYYSGGSGTVTIGNASTDNTFITVWEFMP
jgi:hypothetical protein